MVQTCKLCGKKACFENNIIVTGDGDPILCQDSDGDIYPHIQGCLIIGPNAPERKKFDKLLKQMEKK